MARKKTSPAEDIMDLVAMLPWWMGVALAALSFLVQHPVAIQPITPPADVNAMFLQALWRTGAQFGQYLLQRLLPFNAEA